MHKKKYGFFSWLKEKVSRFFKDSATDYTYSSMADAMEKWLELYYDEPRWLKETHYQSLNLPASICAEFARLIMVVFDVVISGSARADFLNQQFRRRTANLRIKLEKGCAVGGLVFKPYVSCGKVMTDCVIQDEFIPTEFFDDTCVGGVFVNKITKGDRYYWQLEKQRYDYAAKTHTSQSRFFVSEQPDKLGREINVSEYPLPVQEQFTIYNCDLPLFAFWRVPEANTEVKDSPLGISVFARAVRNIREADKQWDRFLWEFEGGELAIDASEFALRQAPVQDSEGNIVKMEMPKTKDRLFRRINARKHDNSAFYEIFAPQLRDSSYGHGLNRIRRAIEWIVGLAYGTLSDPQDVDKTAEEIKASKHRSYTFICNMQASLQTTLEQYIYAIDKYTTVCNLAPSGAYNIQWNWGDGVLEDSDKETQIKLQEVNNNIITKEAYLTWRYSVTEEQAKEMIPSETYQPFFE